MHRGPRSAQPSPTCARLQWCSEAGYRTPGWPAVHMDLPRPFSLSMRAQSTPWQHSPMSYISRRQPRSEHRTLRGLRHRLLWWGEKSDTPVVLLHGWGDCSETWQFLVDCLPADWSLVGLDWRGFGGSEWSPQGYWFPDYFADLEALLEQLSPGKPVRV